MGTFRLMPAGPRLIPEGKHILKIVSVNDKKLDDFGKLEIVLEDSKKRKHYESFTIQRKDKTINEAAMWHLSQFTRAALDLDEYEERDINPKELIGKFIKCEIRHEKVESKKNPGHFNTYSRTGKEKEHAEGFEETTSSENKKPVGTMFDLNNILGE